MCVCVCSVFILMRVCTQCQNTCDVHNIRLWLASRSHIRTFSRSQGAFSSMAGSARVLAERTDLVNDCLKLEATC